MVAFIQITMLLLLAAIVLATGLTFLAEGIYRPSIPDAILGCFCLCIATGIISIVVQQVNIL